MKSLFVAVNALIMVFAVVAEAQETFETDTFKLLDLLKDTKEIEVHIRKMK